MSRKHPAASAMQTIRIVDFVNDVKTARSDPSTRLEEILVPATAESFSPTHVNSGKKIRRIHNLDPLQKDMVDRVLWRNVDGSIEVLNKYTPLMHYYASI